MEQYRTGTLAVAMMNAQGAEKRGGGDWHWRDFFPAPVKPMTDEEIAASLSLWGSAAGAD